jgi:hypothetical protein
MSEEKKQIATAVAFIEDCGLFVFGLVRKQRQRQKIGAIARGLATSESTAHNLTFYINKLYECLKRVLMYVWWSMKFMIIYYILPRNLDCQGSGTLTEFSGMNNHQMAMPILMNTPTPIVNAVPTCPRTSLPTITPRNSEMAASHF